MVFRNAHDRWSDWDDRREQTIGRPCEGKESFRTERQALAKLDEILGNPVKSSRLSLPCRAYLCSGQPIDGEHGGGCFAFHLTSKPLA